jgi:hypothetical protein
MTRPGPAVRIDRPASLRRQRGMIRGFFILLYFQLVGEVAARGLAQAKI